MVGCADRISQRKGAKSAIKKEECEGEAAAATKYYLPNRYEEKGLKLCLLATTRRAQLTTL